MTVGLDHGVKVGLDFDTWKVTICEVHGASVRFEQASIRGPGMSTLDAVTGIPREMLYAASRLGTRPAEIYIERGRGQNRKGEYEMGAIYGAVIVSVRRVWPGAFIESVTTAEWKKAVTAAVGIKTVKGEPGNGNAPKEVANEACRFLLRRYHMNTADLTPDQLDSFGILFPSLGVE